MSTTPKTTDPVSYLREHNPQSPVLFYHAPSLEERISIFRSGFDGQLTFAVKAHPDPRILQDMIEFGVQGFDVASPFEIGLLRSLAPDLKLHYNNPVRTRDEIKFAVENGVESYSVDCVSELEKLFELLEAPSEISVRFKLDLGGAAYHFGSKFGADRFESVEMLKRIASSEHRPSMTFHVGTQCLMPELYQRYVSEAALCAKEAGVEIERLNVGGGFPSARGGQSPDFAAYFAAIQDGLTDFKKQPKLVCEPGRALVGDAFDYVARVKSIMHGRWLFLTDGIYGGLSEFNIVEPPHYLFLSQEGETRIGRTHPATGYGPTCDSIDTLNAPLQVPEDVHEGDFIMFRGMGSYILGPNTRFNGYGDFEVVEVEMPFLP